MKFKDLANGMVFQFAFDKSLGWEWWYTKIDDFNMVCIKSPAQNNVGFGNEYLASDELMEAEVILAKSFSS